MPTLKAIHIAKSHNAVCTNQNLAISMSLPTQIMMLTKLKDSIRNDKTQQLTTAISNAGESDKNENNEKK